MQTSPSYTLNGADLAHIGRHTLYASVSAGIAYLLTAVIPNFHANGDFALAVPVLVFLLTSAQSYFSNHQ